jgi:TrmH family RNA methyltransferase
MSEPLISSKNPNYKTWKSLLTPKGIRKNNLMLICGKKIISEVIETQPQNIMHIIYSGKSSELEVKNIAQTELATDLFKDLDVFGTHYPLLVCKTPIVKQYSFPQDKNSNGLTLFCALSDPANLGALIRSALAFGVQNIILLQEACTPFHPKAIRSSSGALFNLNLFEGPSIHSLPQNIDFYGLNMKGQMLNSDFQWPKQVNLLLGEEGQGLPQEIQLKPLAIPMSSDIESLNATVAASIALYHWSQR